MMLPFISGGSVYWHGPWMSPITKEEKQRLRERPKRRAIFDLTAFQVDPDTGMMTLSQPLQLLQRKPNTYQIGRSNV